MHGLSLTLLAVFDQFQPTPYRESKHVSRVFSLTIWYIYYFYLLDSSLVSVYTDFLI